MAKDGYEKPAPTGLAAGLWCDIPNSACSNKHACTRNDPCVTASENRNRHPRHRGGRTRPNKKSSPPHSLRGCHGWGGSITASCVRLCEHACTYSLHINCLHSCLPEYVLMYMYVKSHYRLPLPTTSTSTSTSTSTLPLPLPYPPIRPPNPLARPPA